MYFSHHSACIFHPELCMLRWLQILRLFQCDMLAVFFPSQDGSGYLGEVQDPSPFLNGFAAVLPLLRQLETFGIEGDTYKPHPQLTSAIQTLLTDLLAAT